MTSRKPPKSGKGSALQARITDDMRKSIEAEADRTGRSLSQVAELWLEFGRAAWAENQHKIGETHRELAAMKAAMTDATVMIEKLWREGGFDKIIKGKTHAVSKEAQEAMHPNYADGAGTSDAP